MPIRARYFGVPFLFGQTCNDIEISYIIDLQDEPDLLETYADVRAAEGDILNEFRHKLVSMCAESEDPKMLGGVKCEHIFRRLEATHVLLSSTFTRKYFGTNNPLIRQYLAKDYFKKLNEALEEVMQNKNPTSNI